MDGMRTVISARLKLHILGDVHDHRTGTSRGGDLKRLVQHARQIVDVLHQPVVLGAGAGDAHRVAFLEGVGADQVGGHLAGEHHQRNGIHQRIGQAGNGIGGAGTGSDQHHAGLAGGTGIAFRSMDRALLMAHQHMGDAFDLEQRVIDRQHCAAGITEDMRDALVPEGADDHLRAGHGFGGRLYPVLGRGPRQCVVLVHRPSLEFQCS